MPQLSSLPKLGSPYNGFPKFKVVDSLDWSLGQWGATLIGRYISRLKESDGNSITSQTYVDGQLRWSPGFMKNLGLAVGRQQHVRQRPARLRDLWHS